MISSKLIARQTFDNGSWVEWEQETDNGQVAYYVSAFSAPKRSHDIVRFDFLPKSRDFYNKIVKFLEFYDI